MAAASCIQEDKEVGETGDAISQGTRSHANIVHGNKARFELLNLTKILSGLCPSSQAACGTPPRADRSSSGAASSYGSRLMYGCHIERGTGDGQPQPRMLATRVQVTTFPLTCGVPHGSVPGHITLTS